MTEEERLSVYSFAIDGLKTLATFLGMGYLEGQPFTEEEYGDFLVSLVEEVLKTLPEDFDEI